MTAVSGRRVAVVLFNLGAPDKPEAVEPFLFNLFSDRAITNLAQPFRWALATLISSRRAPTAREIYEKIGGGSPLLEHTEAQGAALASALAGNGETRVFIAMRYWHPMSDETATAVKAFAPDLVVLLPLYPQFSTTTTASSIAAWRAAAATAGLRADTRAICCYPTAEPFIDAHVRSILPALEEARGHGPVRLLFSAHGLPKRVVARGDPYVWQVGETARFVAQRLEDRGAGGLDWTLCFQSRVGPLEWVGPLIEDEIHRAGQDGVGLVVVPIAFVSEHSETLVELDIDYRARARTVGVPVYIRVPALGADEGYIDTLAALTRRAIARKSPVASCADGRLCPAEFGRCSLATGR